MRRLESKMGAAFVSKQDEPILSIGSDIYSRRRMIVELKCANFGAAARLDWVLKSLRPKSVLDLRRRMGLSDLMSADGVGPITVYVWMKVLENAGKDPVAWLDSQANIPTLYQQARKSKKG